jgi:hypothetical protein
MGGGLSAHQKIMLVAALVLAGLLLTVYAAWPFLPRGDRHEEYLCRRCGMRRETYSSSVLWFDEKHRDVLAPTAVSRAFEKVDRQPCVHAWNRTRFGIKTWRAAADGGASLLLHMLTRDDGLGRDLVAIGRRDVGLAHDIWEALYASTWSEGDPRMKIVEAWWMDGADRKPVGVWYAEHRSRLRR